jgi:hypothetical protein
MASGRFDYEDRGEQPDAHAFAARDADAEDGLLGDPVEKRAQRKPRPRAGAAPLQRSVGDEVRERSRGEAETDPARPANPRAFLDELEAHRADERAGAEGQHDPDLPVGPSALEPEQRADHERRRRHRSPRERAQHRR